MIKVDEKLISQLENLERVANERGITLEEALDHFIIISEGDVTKFVHRPDLTYMTKEIWEVWDAIDRICEEKGYYLSEVIYKASGDLWENKGKHYMDYSYISKYAEERLKGIRNGMIQRCTNPNNQSYSNYGAKKIKVCDEWKNDAKSFIKWAEDNGYANYLTLDRIDPYGNYEPSNCRWASTFTQANNKKNSKKNKAKPFKFCGVTYSTKMLARLHHLIYDKLRINLKKLPLMKAVIQSEDDTFWKRQQYEVKNDQDEEHRLYRQMCERYRYMYDSLVRSCIVNDVDIYELLKSLLHDLENSVETGSPVLFPWRDYIVK